MDKYKVLRKLTSGGQATIFICEKNSNPGVELVLKSVQCESMSEANTILREIMLFYSFKHENIIEYLDAFLKINEIDDEFFVMTIMPYYQMGDLSRYILDNFPLNEHEILNIFVQIGHGVKYLHENKVCHRDLKPENCLVDQRDGKLNIKVADFGLSKEITKTQIAKTVCGTPQFMAPEVFKGDYDTKVDIFSMGGILYFILTKNTKMFYLEILEQRGLYMEIEKEIAQLGYSKHIANLMSRCLSLDPKDRPSIDVLLNISNNLMLHKKDIIVGDIPSKRYSHVSWMHQDKIYTFGGHVVNEQSLSHDVHCCDVSNFEIRMLSEDPRRPSGLCWAASCFYKASAFISGGVTDGKYQNTIFEFDTIKSEWKRVKFQLPHSVSRHTAVLYKDSMVCFGGMEKNTELKVFSDLFVFDLKNNKGKVIETKIKRRYGHAACVWKDFMFVYGGIDDTDSNLLPDENFVACNLETYEFVKIASKGDVPIPRSGHTVCVWNDSMILFGGLKDIEGGYRQILNNDILYTYSFTDSIWKRIRFSGEFPIKSCLHSAEIFMNNMYIIYGEAWNGHLRNEIYCLNLEKMDWKNLMGTQFTLINEWCFKHGYVCIFCTGKLKIRQRFHCIKCFGSICELCYSKGQFKSKTCDHEFLKINRFLDLYEYYMSPKAPLKTGRFEGRNRTLKGKKDGDVGSEKQTQKSKDKKKGDDLETGSPFSPSPTNRGNNELFGLKCRIIDLEAYVQELEEKLLEKEKTIQKLTEEVQKFQK